MPASSRLKMILTKSISILVIVLNLTLAALAWIVQDDLSRSAVSIFNEVDRIAGVVRNGLARVEPQISILRELVGQVESASEAIAQNVSEEGIISRMLPETLAGSLAATSQSLQENFVAVYDLLSATSDMLLALDRIPFVEIPESGLTTIGTLQSSMEEFAGQVESLQTMISDVRNEAGARISQVTQTAALLGAGADQIRSDLIQIDLDLDAMQISVRKYQRIAPPVILTSTVLISLLSGWVVYSQVWMISKSTIKNLDQTRDRPEGPQPQNG